jgi:hypothetical protein
VLDAPPRFIEPADVGWVVDDSETPSPQAAIAPKPQAPMAIIASRDGYASRRRWFMVPPAGQV